MKKKSCNIYVMPPKITDDDISALFNGIVNVVRHKIEMDAKAEILNLNINQERLMRELKNKTNECVRLKNEIIYLKQKLEEKP